MSILDGPTVTSFSTPDLSVERSGPDVVVEVGVASVRISRAVSAAPTSTAASDLA
jgi:hypothetical protein